MGKQQKRRRQPFKGFGEEPATVIFLGKEHYDAEWPGTSLVVENAGILTVDVRGDEVSVLGHEFTVHTPGGSLNGVYGLRLHRELGHPPQMVVNACFPTRAADLKPYMGFVTGMLGDMIRNGAIPSYEDLAKEAIEAGALSTPAA